VLHDFICQHKAEILDICACELKQKYPERDDDDLIDGIPNFIDELIVELQSEAASAPGCIEIVAPAASSQARLRRQQGFDLCRVVHDFGLVYEAINTVVLRHGETPAPREYQVLGRCLDNAIALAVESFSRQQHNEDDLRKAEDFGMLAHEIRNAISNALTGYELIQQGRAKLDSPTGDIVQRALSRIAQLVTDTLTMAQITGTANARCQKHCFADILRPLIQEIDNRKDIRIAVEIEPGLSVHADATLLSSAISNLLQNAVKFTKQGGAIGLRAFSAGGFVFIEVEDTCGGLPEGSEQELFRPFVQKGSDRSGAGLGLVIARRAVEAHGGTLHVRNMPGLGCVFAVTIPRSSERRNVVNF